MRLGLWRETRRCTILLDTEQHQFGLDNNFPEDNPLALLGPGGNRTSPKGKVNMRVSLTRETRRCTILQGRQRAQAARLCCKKSRRDKARPVKIRKNERWGKTRPWNKEGRHRREQGRKRTRMSSNSGQDRKNKARLWIWRTRDRPRIQCTGCHRDQARQMTGLGRQSTNSISQFAP